MGLRAAVLRSLGTLVSEAHGPDRHRPRAPTSSTPSRSPSISSTTRTPTTTTPCTAPSRRRPTGPRASSTTCSATGQASSRWWPWPGCCLTLHWGVGLIVLVAAIPGALVRLRYSRQAVRAGSAGAPRPSASPGYAHWLLTDSDARQGDPPVRPGRPLPRPVPGAAPGSCAASSSASPAPALAGRLGAGAGRRAGRVRHLRLHRLADHQGAITLGMMVTYYQAFQTSLASLQAVLGGLAGLYEDNLFLTYYDEFMALEPHVLPPAQPAPVPRPMAEGIRFEHVDFSYPDTERTALAGRLADHPPGRGHRARRAQRLGQDHAGQAALPALRPHRRRHHPRRRRPAPLRRRRPAPRT